MILCCDHIILEGGSTILEKIGDIAMILIAMFNTVLVWRMFIKTNDQGKIDKDQARNLGLLKSLILDHNLIHFYNFFERLESTLCELKGQGLTNNQKADTIELGAVEFVKLRTKFIDTLLAIDKNLYENVLDSADKLQKCISENVFDNGNNLNYEPKFDECIAKPLRKVKTDILCILYKYKG